MYKLLPGGIPFSPMAAWTSRDDARTQTSGTAERRRTDLI